MAFATLTNRISSAIAAGELTPQLSLGWGILDFTVGDLLRPWGELYPGIPSEDDGADRTEPFGYRSPLHRPAGLAPVPRRSSRPLPAPQRIPSSPRLLKASLLASVAGVWDYYRAHDLADERLLHLPLIPDSVETFIEPLAHSVSDYDPMGMDLENLHIGKSVAGFEGFQLFIPCETYEDEGAGVIQAFLEGVSGVRWLLENYFDSADNGDDLPKQDRKLLADVGFEDLVQAHADFQGPKSADIHRLGDFANTYFGTVQHDFPDQWERDFAIICGNGGGDNFLRISSRQDIEFALAYGHAYTDMMSDIPTPWAFMENCDGMFDEFIHEVCEAWRKANGKRSVKWISPRKQTLLSRFRTGDL